MKRLAVVLVVGVFGLVGCSMSASTGEDALDTSNPDITEIEVELSDGTSLTCLQLSALGPVGGLTCDWSNRG